MMFYKEVEEQKNKVGRTCKTFKKINNKRKL